MIVKMGDLTGIEEQRKRRYLIRTIYLIAPYDSDQRVFHSNLSQTPFLFTFKLSNN